MSEQVDVHFPAANDAFVSSKFQTGDTSLFSEERRHGFSSKVTNSRQWRSTGVISDDRQDAHYERRTADCDRHDGNDATPSHGPTSWSATLDETDWHNLMDWWAIVDTNHTDHQSTGRRV